ncbi:hypothetical protein Pfo_026954 [Paulownia fortunei]|nr:hypothetical protein Pfo_026954 [Paulownia fortunei]
MILFKIKIISPSYYSIIPKKEKKFLSFENKIIAHILFFSFFFLSFLFFFSTLRAHHHQYQSHLSLSWMPLVDSISVLFTVFQWPPLFDPISVLFIVFQLSKTTQMLGGRPLFSFSFLLMLRGFFFSRWRMVAI